MDIKVNLKGFAEIDRLLSQLPEKTQKRVINKVVTRGAAAMRDSVRERVPPGRLGKRLKRAIKSKRRREKAGVFRASVLIDNNKAPDWHWWEYGTASRYRGIKTESKGRAAVKERRATSRAMAASGNKKGYTGEVKPQPFVRPAFDQDGEQVVKEMMTAAMKGIIMEAVKLK